jgi:hypothetical protein
MRPLDLFEYISAEAISDQYSGNCVIRLCKFDTFCDIQGQLRGYGNMEFMGDGSYGNRPD